MCGVDGEGVGFYGWGWCVDFVGEVFVIDDNWNFCCYWVFEIVLGRGWWCDVWIVLVGWGWGGVRVYYFENYFDLWVFFVNLGLVVCWEYVYLLFVDWRWGMCYWVFG